MPVLHTTRFRSRTDYGQVPAHLQNYYNGSLWSEYIGQYESFTFYHSIRDNTNRKVNGKYPDSDVQSVKIEGKLLSSLPDYAENPQRSSITRALKYPPLIKPEAVLGMVPDFPDSLWDDFYLDAFSEFGNQVPEEISSYNFLWEAQKIGELIPKLSSSISKSVSDGYLNYQFGWKPFLGDLKTLGNIATVVQDRLNHLIAINGKTTRLSSKRKNAMLPVAYRPWTPGNWQLRLRSYDATLRANARLYSNLDGLKSESAFWKAAVVTLGLTNPTKALWESVPFSFMFDWFNRMGKRIFNLAVNPFKGDYVVSRPCTSLAETALIDFRWNYLYDAGINPLVKIGTFTVNRFTRYAGFPAQPSIFNIDGLSPKQQTLFMALLNSAR